MVCDVCLQRLLGPLVDHLIAHDDWALCVHTEYMQLILVYSGKTISFLFSFCGLSTYELTSGLDACKGNVPVKCMTSICKCVYNENNHLYDETVKTIFKTINTDQHYISHRLLFNP